MSTSSSAGPLPSSRPLKSSRIHVQPGPLIGGILAVISVIFAFFLWRYLNAWQAKAVMRQQYLANELRAIEKQREALLQVQQQMRGTGASMGEVESDTAAQSSTTTDSAGGIDRTPREQDLERQNELLRQRIRHLEEQQSSDWAWGRSDLPPPGYSEAPI
ncbi:hypothetical protein R3P38DRAFT_3314691 [Favolaschia claudopus]|uniref:Uncharacterized protein n=1 Tax=Favolaschia claudopus TaxID=2862362 RepID=A0AAW0BU87_9AGAR